MGILEKQRFIPLLDEEQLQSIKMAIGSDVAVAEDLVATYTGECEPAMDALKEACQSQNLPETQRLAHFMAGSSGNLGLKRACLSFRALEEAIIDGEALPLGSLPDEIRSIYAESLQALRVYFGLC